MSQARARIAGRVLWFVVAVGVLFLTALVDVAGAADEVETGPAQATEQDVAASEGTGAVEEQEMAALDPETGEFILLNEIADRIVHVRPGDIRCRLTQADCATPQPGATVTLVDAQTVEEVVTLTTDENGECVFEDVPEGRYVVVLADGTFWVALVVTENAEVGMLNIALPAHATLPFSAWAPAWMHTHPFLATLAVTATGTVLVGAPVAYYSREREEDRQFLSPITP